MQAHTLHTHNVQHASHAGCACTQRQHRRHMRASTRLCTPQHGLSALQASPHTSAAHTLTPQSDAAGSQQHSHHSTRRGLLLAGLVALPLLSSTHADPAHAAGSGLRAPSDAERRAIMQCLNKVIEQPKAPVLLRLPFHDAGTFSISGGNSGGANASVRLELDRPENAGLKRGWRVIEQLSEAIKGTAAEGVVSQADLVFLAGAHAVRICNGPEIGIKIGRPDASVPDPEGRLPSENASAAELLASFSDKSFCAQEFVALSGAHTVGGKGFGAPYAFDNTYYKELLKKPWLNTENKMAAMIGLPSDKVMPDSPALLPIIKEYAEDQQAFFRDFSNAYVKLSELGV